ncbi:MAG TPA: hypothetical protein VKR61_18230 [Bryobacteraceae bacterium]|nr:hypothetical protein [Bryobacteraceae bacterium]
MVAVRRLFIAGRANLPGVYEVYHGDYGKLFPLEQTLEAVTADRGSVTKPGFAG